MNGLILHRTDIYFDKERGAVCYHLGGEEKEITLGFLQTGSIYRVSKVLVNLYRIETSLGSFYEFILSINNKRKVISICNSHIKEIG